MLTSSQHLDFFVYFHGLFESNDSVFLAMKYYAAQLGEQTVEVRKRVVIGRRASIHSCVYVKSSHLIRFARPVSTRGGADGRTDGGLANARAGRRAYGYSSIH